MEDANIGVNTLHGVEHRTDLTGEHLSGQLRCSRGMLLMMMTAGLQSAELIVVGLLYL